MSERGRQFFERYVSRYVADPNLATFGLQTHVFSLRAQARDVGILPQEIEEEVGPLSDAVADAMKSHGT